MFHLISISFQYGSIILFVALTVFLELSKYVLWILVFFTFSLSHILVFIVQTNVSFILSFLKNYWLCFIKEGRNIECNILFFCEYLCVGECITYMFMWVYGHVYSSVNSYVWRPESEAGCCSLWPFILLSETHPRACQWFWDGSWWMDFGFSSVFVTLVLGAQLLCVFRCFVLRLSHLFYLILAVFECPKLSW